MYINPKGKADRLKESDITDYSVRAIGEREFPLFHKLIHHAQFMAFPKAVLEGDPYYIKGLLNIGAAISNNYPNSKLFEKALSELEFFVNIDRFLTKDSLYADVVLPATTYYEDESFSVFKDRVEIKKRVIDPIGQAKPNIFILQKIAQSLGFGDCYPKDENELIEYAFYSKPQIVAKLKEDGVYYFPKNENIRLYKKYELGMLRKDGKRGFPTPTGKFELYSTLLKSYNYEPLPKFEFAKEGEFNSPKLFEKYPLILNTGARIKSTFRTQHLNIEGLVKHQDRPEVLINPLDAKCRGIVDGDYVRLFNHRGSVNIYAKVTTDVEIGDLEVNVGGGSPFQTEKWKNCNINYLTDDENYDVISGFPCFKNLLCDLEKI